MSSTLAEYETRLWRNFWLFMGAVVVAFVLFISLVVFPSHAERQEACEAKGGVIVGKYGDCIKKEYVL